MRNLNTILTLGFATTAVTTTLQDKGESTGRHAADGFCYTASPWCVFCFDDVTDCKVVP